MGGKSEKLEIKEVYYPDINRAAVIVKLKKPFIDWLVYTSKEYDGPEHDKGNSGDTYFSVQKGTCPRKHPA